MSAFIETVDRLRATIRPELGPAQLEISHVGVELDEHQLDSKQVVYVDIRCGSDLFRTTAQARKFDPLARAAPVKFDMDQGLLTIPAPLTAQVTLKFSLRQCQIFGDTDVCAVDVPVGALPLVKETRVQQFRAGRFTFGLLPVNIGYPPDEATVRDPAAILEVTEGISSQTFQQRRINAPSTRTARRHGTQAKDGRAGDDNAVGSGGTAPPVTPGTSSGGVAAYGANHGGSGVRDYGNARIPLPPPAQLGSSSPRDQSPSTTSRPAVSSGQADCDDGEVPGRARVIFRRRDDEAERIAAGTTGGPHPNDIPSSGATNRRPADVDPTSAVPLREGQGDDGQSPEGGADDIPRDFYGPEPDFSDTQGPLQVFRNPEALKPLFYTGRLPVEDPPELPTGYRRSLRLRGLLDPAQPTTAPRNVAGGGLRSLFDAVTGVMAEAAHDMANVVDLELMRGHFPAIRSPLIASFRPHVLNGHGVPIDGILFVTTKEVAFSGALLNFHVHLASMPYMRRCTAFGKDCLQLFCEGNTVYQLQEMDGIVARLGSAIGVRTHTKFFEAFCLVTDLWRHAHGLSAGHV
jgi:hypothetical protein